MTHTAREPHLPDAAAALETLSAAARIAWAVRAFGHDLTFACSFGAEDMVVLDLLLREKPDASVFLLDTGRLPQETYDLVATARRHYGRGFQVYVPQTEALERLLAEHGPNSFFESVAARRECCRVRKVEPLQRALRGARAWLTGLRRGQSLTRTTLPLAEVDETHGGILKLNPLADWSEAQVWEYLRARGIPFNALHERGYPSIGCAACTRAIAPGEDVRSGRWWWEAPAQKECGLHLRGAARRGAVRG